MNHDADDEEGAVLGAPSKKSRRSPFKGALLGCDWFAARSCNGCGTFGCNDCNDVGLTTAKVMSIMMPS